MKKQTHKKTDNIVHVNLNDLRRRKTAFNRKKVASTTDCMIAAQIAKDSDTAPDVTKLPVLWRRDVSTLRARLGLTQMELASLLRISIGTIRNWEQGRTQPDGAASALLTVLEREPKAVMRALNT